MAGFYHSYFVFVFSIIFFPATVLFNLNCMEEWRHYKTNQSDIEISNLGNVRGVKWRGKAFDNSLITLNHKGRRCIGATQLFTLIWKLFNGPIPKGYCVHHIDHNKLNDRLDNLQLMTVCEHFKHHTEIIFHKGYTPWNKGKKISDKTRLKISEANKGKKLSDETKHKMSEAQKKRRQNIV